MTRNVAVCFAVIAIFAGISLAQSNSQSSASPSKGVTASGVPEDSAGRPVETSSTPEVPPQPAPTNERQDFLNSVKDVHFDFDRANLRPDDRATLVRDAEWLKAHPKLFFTIEGDADERGNIAYNVFLSDQRALVTRDELLRLGVPEDQILFASGWGKLYPVCTQSDESCWSQNRRSHLAPWPPDDINSRANAPVATGSLKNSTPEVAGAR